MKRLGKAVGRPVQPDFSDPRIRRGRQQQPDAFDALARGANRAGIDVLSRAQKIDSPQDVVRPSRRQADADLVRPGVGQPIADVGTAIVIRKTECRGSSTSTTLPVSAIFPANRSESLPASNSTAGCLPDERGT